MKTVKFYVLPGVASVTFSFYIIQYIVTIINCLMICIPLIFSPLCIASDLHESEQIMNNEKFKSDAVQPVSNESELIEIAERKSRHLLSIMDSMNDLVFVLDENLTYTEFYQPSNSEQMYWPPDQLVGHKVNDIISEPLLSRILKAFDEVRSGSSESFIDYSMELKGELRYFEARITRLRSRFDNLHETECSEAEFDVIVNHGFICVARDITDRKLAEAELRLSRANLAALIDNTEAFILFSDENAMPVVYNKAYSDAIQEIFGVEMHQGFQAHTMLETLEGRQWWENCHKRVLSGEKFTTRFSYNHHGRNLHFEVAFNPVIRDGRIFGFSQFATDITEKLEAEKERVRLTERLVAAERMEALGRLAGGVAHDLNNVLCGIVGYPDLMMKRVNLSDEVLVRQLNAMKLSGQKASRIVDDLLSLTRRNTRSKDMLPTDLFSLFREFLASPEFLNIRKSHKNISISINAPETVPLITGQRGQLEKVIMNLINNSIEAMIDGGELRIDFSVIELQDETEIFIGDYLAEPLVPGNYLMIRIQDSGKGFEPTEALRIFEPFYTGKTQGRSGTGLGLAVVWGVIEDHDARISVETEPGKGSAFTLFFRLQNEDITSGISEDIRKPRDYPDGHGRRILVVDDEEDQRELMSEILGDSGFSVLKAASGQECIDIYNEFAPELVIMDMILGNGMDGHETLARIKALDSNVKALVVSGYTNIRNVQMVQELGFVHFLAKPYTPKLLLNAVHNIFEEEDS